MRQHPLSADSLGEGEGVELPFTILESESFPLVEAGLGGRWCNFNDITTRAESTAAMQTLL
jgi:hypothetical protein